MSDGASSEPVIAPLPTPISVEPRTAPPAEVAEIARQAEEAKLPAASKKEEPIKVAAKDEPKKPLSTREALRAAREKVEAEPASPLKTEPKVAEPAPAAKEPAKTEPVRGEDGKFVSTKPATELAAKAAEPASAKVDGAKTAEPAPKAAEPAKPSFTAEPPPARFSAAAKERWAEAPDEVRAEVTRAVTELTKGFEKHREAATRDADLNEFHEMATKGGTTVKEALSKYVGMEQALRNPATRDQGIEAIFANVGISSREWAAKLLGQTPDAAASQQDATIRELRDHIARLEKTVGTVTETFQKQQTDSTTEAVAKFAAENPRFEELSEDIAFFLKTRTKDLAEAYKLAERLNPAPVKAPEPEPTPAPAPASSAAPVVTLVPPTPPASTAGQKSIAGAPTAGSDPVRKQPSSSIREALRRAQQRAG